MITKTIVPRKHRRIGCHIEAVIEFQKPGQKPVVAPCIIENLSYGGAGIRLLVPIFKGETVVLAFWYEGRGYRLRGKAVRDINWTKRCGIAFDKPIDFPFPEEDHLYEKLYDPLVS